MLDSRSLALGTVTTAPITQNGWTQRLYNRTPFDMSRCELCNTREEYVCKHLYSIKSCCPILASPFTSEQGYEPYLVALRQNIPWYDERFRGYGRDKITHLLHVSSTLCGLKHACLLCLELKRDCATMQPSRWSSKCTLPLMSSMCLIRKRPRTRLRSGDHNGTMYVRPLSGV